MSLEKAPPSRYRIEEKNGRLIVHDNLSNTVLGNQFAQPQETRSNLASNTAGAAIETAAQPVQRARSALDNVAKSLPARPALGASADLNKAKRGVIVAVVAVFAGIFLVLTSLWIGVVIAFVIAPIRQAIVDRAFPAIKLYIAEGRFR